jgi:hypothetical protein
VIRLRLSNKKDPPKRWIFFYPYLFLNKKLMAITKEEIQGTKILNEVESSNLVRTEYDTATKKMIAEFKNGMRYEYENVPHQKYTEFRSAQSQGNYFNKNISKSHTYKKL